ncbi:MAG: LAGLIDADG family homing endonuclease [Candidatus Moranbacteria bacterium]|nr:LAGLIDADG family homing endonuclease [Candidatus Moranbacteria bacterium]
MGIKHKVNEDFFKFWTQEMAYTLGYFYADGSMQDSPSIRGKYMRISSAEKNNLIKIKEWMQSQHIITERQRDGENILYLLKIGSHELYKDLEKLGLYPNKSLTIKFPDIPKKFLNHFVRGYFDGDGCVRVCMKKGKTQPLIISKLCTVFTSGSKEFLEELAVKIRGCTETNLLKVYNGNRAFMLSYTTGDSVKIFKFMYGNMTKPVFLERKALVYSHYFDLRPQRLDKKVKSVLQYIKSE